MPQKFKSKIYSGASGRRRAQTNKNNMKKTTKKGAYAKNKKKQMVIRTNPIMETKRRVHSIITARNFSTAGAASSNYQDTINGLSVPNNDAFTLLNLASFYRMSHGFLEENTIGDSVYSKRLNLKAQFRWPEGENMIVNPVKVYLITGWCSQPTGWTNNTTPTEGDATQTYLFAHITNQLKEYFDQREDFLRFRERTTSNLRISKWQKVTPNLKDAIAAPAGQIDHEADPTKPAVIRTVGAVPFVNRSHSWPINRKIHLSEGTALATGNDAPSPDTQNLYPNDSWLPFAVIYNPDFARMRNAADEDVTMTVAYNDIHYYRDS
jgi:hypothetical protein